VPLEIQTSDVIVPFGKLIRDTDFKRGNVFSNRAAGKLRSVCRRKSLIRSIFTTTSLLVTQFFYLSCLFCDYSFRSLLVLSERRTIERRCLVVEFSPSPCRDPGSSAPMAPTHGPVPPLLPRATVRVNRYGYPTPHLSAKPSQARAHAARNSFPRERSVTIIR
jgi:hypothetical protein